MTSLNYDLCVIGGGINGAAIARDAAGRGLSVLVVDAHDFAGATSSASTKLIHGGLRYLEQFDFALVKKSLKEREVLLKNCAPLVWPIRCSIPNSNLIKRSNFFISLGLFLYDRIGGRTVLDRSRYYEGHKDPIVKPLSAEYNNGFVYSDCWCDDTRLVIMNLVDAAQRGARVLNYTECVGLRESSGRWEVDLRDTRHGDELKVFASMVVNATGPWVNRFLDSVDVGHHDPDLPKTRMVKGSHVIINRHYEGDQAYVLQQSDGRVVFVAPYEGRYTLIGTTEEDYDSDPRDAFASDAERAYLLSAFNSYFEHKILESDVIFTYSGIRPLLDDGEGNATKVSRDHLIYHHKRRSLPLLSIFGGKLTTHRAVADEVVDKLIRLSARNYVSWTADHPLIREYKAGEDDLSWLPDELLDRYKNSYGDRLSLVLAGAESLSELGYHFGDGVYESELDYLVHHEWVTCAEDVIWRRSKLGLWISDQTIDAIEGYFRGQYSSD